MTAKPRQVHDRQQHVVRETLDVGDGDGEGAYADLAEGAVAGDDDRRLWAELHDVLHSRLDIADKLAVDKV